MKIRPADTLFSKWVRRNGKCEICGRSDIKLEAAHYFGRRKESVRFDERNVHCLCWTCHKKSHEDLNYYKDWLINELGQDGFDRLEYDSNQRGDKDDQLVIIFYKDKVKELNGQED